MLPEDALVSAIARAVGPPSGGVALGIGDDGAVLDDGTVASTDVLVEGVHFDLARMSEHGVPIAGGDLSRAPVLIVSVTAIGRSERPVRRSGGRPGDVLVVTGELGGQAAAGYAGRITPRIEEGCTLAAVATAMIDLSDGIATDAERLARASGTGAVVELE